MCLKCWLDQVLNSSRSGDLELAHLTIVDGFVLQFSEDYFTSTVTLGNVYLATCFPVS